MCVEASLGPVGRPFDGFIDFVPFGDIGRTLIKCHDDIGTQCVLGLDRGLGIEEKLIAIDMRPEPHTIVGYFPRFEGKHLKPSRVSEYRTIPPGETMQSSKLFDDIRSRAQEEVIGITEQSRRTDAV
jgi:hypothetical protein